MQITFLGTSHGVPEPNRKCSCVMIEVGGRYYLIDMGVMVINELITRGIPIDAVKGVFLTHMHGDHTNGLLHFADLLSWYFKTPEPVICLPAMESVKVINDWITVNGAIPRALQYREVKPGELYDDGCLSVTAIPTRHCDRSYAYLVKAEGKTLLFTGDLQHPSVDFPVGSDTEIDLAVCEAAHFSPLDYVPIFAERKIRQVFITHYSPKWHSDALRLAKESETIPVKLTNDGLIVHL